MRTVDEQKYFYKMFEEMWGDDVYGEVMPVEVQYSLCEELATYRA